MTSCLYCVFAEILSGILEFFVLAVELGHRSWCVGEYNEHLNQKEVTEPVQNHNFPYNMNELLYSYDYVSKEAACRLNKSVANLSYYIAIALIFTLYLHLYIFVHSMFL